MKKILLFIVLMAFTLTACQNEDLTTAEPSDIENAAKGLGFIKLKDQISIYDSTQTKNIQRRRNAPPKNLDLIIFSAKIARAKYDCKKGFGLCDIKILGIPVGLEKSDPYQALDEKYDDVCSTLVENNMKEGSYVTLQIANSPESAGIENMPAFYIDEYIEEECVINDSTYKVSIAPGAYEYNEAIGENGGFKIGLSLENETVSERNNVE